MRRRTVCTCCPTEQPWLETTHFKKCIVYASCFVQCYRARYVIKVLILWSWQRPSWNLRVRNTYTQCMYNRALYTHVNVCTFIHPHCQPMCCAHSLATVLIDFHPSLVHIKSFCSTSLTHATTPALSMKLNAIYFNEKKNWAFSFLFRIGPSYPNCAPGVLSNWLKRLRHEASHPSPSRILLTVNGIVPPLLSVPSWLSS